MKIILHQSIYIIFQIGHYYTLQEVTDRRTDNFSRLRDSLLARPSHTLEISVTLSDASGSALSSVRSSIWVTRSRMVDNMDTLFCISSCTSWIITIYHLNWLDLYLLHGFRHCFPEILLTTLSLGNILVACVPVFSCHFMIFGFLIAE